MLLLLISQLKSCIPDPHAGLPEEIFEFITTITPMVNVDLVVYDSQNRILFSWRDDEHCGAGWLIPGGIVRVKEKREERIVKTAMREFGCEVRFEPTPFSVNEVIMPQEVRGHFAYRCYLPANDAIPEHMVWNANLSKEDAVGKLKWHARSSEQWVRGQREVYESLFEDEKL